MEEGQGLGHQNGQETHVHFTHSIERIEDRRVKKCYYLCLRTNHRLYMHAVCDIY